METEGLSPTVILANAIASPHFIWAMFLLFATVTLLLRLAFHPKNTEYKYNDK